MRALENQMDVGSDFIPDRIALLKEQQTYEQHLQESERRLQEAARLARLGYWELDITSNTLHWSTETFRIFDLDPEAHEPSYEAYLELIHPKDREFVGEEFRNSVQNHSQFNVYHRLTLKTGEVKFVNERCLTYYNDFGEPVRSLGTILDLTDHEREVEKLLRAKAGLEIYAGGLEDEIEELNEELEQAKLELTLAQKNARSLAEDLLARQAS
jgi:PAS domain-containing protein